MHPDESFLGDKAYIGCEHITGQFKRPPKSKKLPAFKQCWNSLHGYYRVTVEHVFGFASYFGFFNQRHRGHIGTSSVSTERYQTFARFIFEVCNLHFHLQEKQKRSLKPMLVDRNTGINLLPRMDDCEEMRRLRIRLHACKSNFVSRNATITDRNINTGYAYSSFAIKDQVWFFRLDSFIVCKAQIWSITQRKDDPTTPYYSIRTTQGKYFQSIKPNMLIPYANDRTPSVDEFVLFRPPSLQSFGNQDQTSRIEKRQWRSIKHEPLFNKISLLDKLASQVFEESSKRVLRIRSKYPEFEVFEEPSESDYYPTESEYSINFSSSSSDEDVVEEGERMMVSVVFMWQ